MSTAWGEPHGAPDAGRHCFETLESHTAGNPTRTVLSGVPPLRGATMLERMHDLAERYDWVRTSLTLEPRGSSVMSGCVLTEPCDPAADVGVLYIESSGHLPMCGHDTIGLVTVLLETGRLPVTGEITKVVLDTPAGLVETEATVAGTPERPRVTSVSFLSTPSFLLHRDAVLDVEGVGPLTVDISWGGNFYAIVSAEEAGVDLDQPRVGHRIDVARRIREAAAAQLDVRHPVLEGVQGLTHVQLIGPPTDPGATNRCSVVIQSDAADRSPCGTGTSARTATLVARGELRLGETLVHESITGGLFRSTPVELLDVGGVAATRNAVAGTAHLVGTATWIVDRDQDPMADGFLVV